MRRAEKYRASQARECAAHITRDMLAAYKPATISRTLGTLKKALSIAWDRGQTPENYGLRVKRMAENNARESFRTIEQVRRIADHCSKPAQSAIWAALLTSARRGEVLKIQRHHIHADHIEIPASHTKTLRTRSVQIIPALRPHLEHFPIQVTLYRVQTAFRRGRKKALLEHVHFHDLRHSCASIPIGLGVDLYTVAKILGHTSVNTTQRYAHLQIDKQRAALDKLGDMVALDAEMQKAPPH
jgi:integrase